MQCEKCKSPVGHRFVKCGESAYHEECFICDFCAEGIAGERSVVKDGCRYCWPCFEKIHATKCSVCDEIITGSKLTAVDTDYHKACFACYECKQSLVDEKEHYFERYGHECAVCHRPVLKQCVQALNRQMHFDCFVCKQCHKPIEVGSNYYEDGGEALCLLCYSAE